MQKAKNMLQSLLPSYLLPGHKDYRKQIKHIHKFNASLSVHQENAQLILLKDIVKYVWNNSNGYRSHWKEKGFALSELNALSDLQNIPTIDKITIRDNVEDFSIKTNNPFTISTSGSTGTPFKFYNDHRIRSIEKAYVTTMLNRHTNFDNYRKHRSYLRGMAFQEKYINDPLHGLLLNSKYLDEESVKLFLSLMDRKKSRVFHVYPSALYIMCKIMLRLNIPRPEHVFDVILFGSEPLLPFQLEVIEQVFFEKKVICYGNTEKSVFASKEINDSNYKIERSYGIVEVDVKDEENNLGELITTSFHNRATPFIRYLTNDIASVDRAFNANSIKDISGRKQEFIVSKKAKLISMTYFNIHDNTLDGVDDFMFFQDEAGLVQFKYISKNNNVNLEMIKKKFFEIFGSDVYFDIKRCNVLPLNTNGKKSFIKQSINLEDYF